MRSDHAALSVILALFVGFSVGFLFAPDPTGIAPILFGSVPAVVLAPILYHYLGKET
ncbi:hypothetical protein [Halorussus pelagicus]|uniref:hypothetical protein n=1 Tax=Halorussus pelagicus TaxID=2505977 RepID=UPI0014076571|nr:hypothetical protein [Halorussus pelagicus]